MALNIVKKIDNMVKIKNVIVSVSDKANLDIFVKKMTDINPEITFFSTGGTYKYLSGINGIKEGNNLLSVSDYTGQPEMQGGLVKTLDFRIYTGILAEKYNDIHMKDIEKSNSVLFDMVIVNLYPFEEAIRKKGATFEEARANIDIGGPCMLRAAAKNFHRVATVCDTLFYETIAEELGLKMGALSLKTRFSLSASAFRHTAKYDKMISDYLSETDYSLAENCYTISQQKEVE